MRIAKHALLSLAVGSMVLLAAPPARAQQLLSNFGFDTGLTAWATCCGGTGTVDWDGTRDARDSTLSGSVRLVHTDLFDGISETALFVRQCVDASALAAGTKVFFGMKARFEEGETTLGRAYLSVNFDDQSDCSGTGLGGAQAEVQATDAPRGTWLAVKRNAAAGVALPAGTKGLKIFAVIAKSSTGTLTANLDDVWIASTTTPLCDGMPATIIGDGTDQFINGTNASDVIVAKGGNDIIDAKAGNDRVCGGPGDDTIAGGNGDDRLFGEGGKDTLWGDGDDDLLYGAGNNDTLYGGTGNDKLRGGTGVDTCYGDAGTNVKKKCGLPFIVPF